jgi:DNA-binding GntR family transcriptional regulator
MVERDGMKVAKHLRESILRLELRPGESLDEASLSETLGFSRTPIREAIIALVADGLVVRDGRKAKVAPLDFDDVPKLFDALLISSRMIHRLAAQNRTADDLEAIKENMLRFENSINMSSGVERSESNLSFHQSIASAAHNRYFASFYDQALVGTIRLARACFSGSIGESDGTDTEVLKDHIKETVSQHRVIFETIKDRDVEAADEAAVMHHTLTKSRLQKVIFSGSLALGGSLDLSFGAGQ